MSVSSLQSLYSKFITDKGSEVQGADLDLGPCVITCARMGGSNEAYEKDFMETFEPYNQVMDLGEMPEEKARELNYGVFARTIVKRWRYRNPENPAELLEGIGPDTPLTVENVIEMFKLSHDMYVRVRGFAMTMDNFLLSKRAAASKN